MMKGKGPTPGELNGLAALFKAGRPIELESRARSLLAKYPGSGIVWNALGVSLQSQGKDALAVLQKASELLPRNFSVISNLGNALKSIGRFDDALASFRRALEINPDFAEGHYNLGVTLQSLKQPEDAVASYRLALQIKPDLIKAHNNLGNVLRELGRLDDAETSFRRALEINPDFAEGYSNLGNVQKELGQIDEAEASFRRAVELNPGFAEGHYNLGSTLQDLKRNDEAMACYQRALAIKPGYTEAHNNLGTTLKDLGRLDDAVTCYRRALQCNPDYAMAHSNLLFTLNYHPDKRGEVIYAAYQEYEQRFGLPYRSQWRNHGNNREQRRRLKVGYVSPDFKRHAVRNFLEPLLSQHDKNAVEIYAYAELTKEDQVTARYRGYMDHWVLTRGMGDDTLAERIRADGIDILVDLAGHTAHNRLGVFARKPAPVSLSWLGYGYTTGLTAVDYFLTDGTTVPEGSEGLFSETLCRLKTPAHVFRPAEGMGLVSPLPATECGHVTFGTLTRAVRINHRTIRVWSAILKRVEGGRLVIDSHDFKSATMQDALAEKFAAHGIGRDRLEIGFHSPPWDVLRGMDIGLDCFPHNSGTTLFETLYMGVPFVTLAERPSVGRLGSSILEGAGHREWIARTEDEYVEMAVALATDLPKLAGLRAGLRGEMEASPVMDEAGFARKVEAAYREMWVKWSGNGQCGGKMTPSHKLLPQAEPTLNQTLQHAIDHHRVGRLQEAERLYRTILEIQPNHPDANYNLGVLVVQAGKPAVALPLLKTALEANPKQGLYWLIYAETLLKAGHTEAARSVLAQGRQRGLEGEALEALSGRLDHLENATPDQPTEQSGAGAWNTASHTRQA